MMRESTAAILHMSANAAFYRIFDDLCVPGERMRTLGKTACTILVRGNVIQMSIQCLLPLKYIEKACSGMDMQYLFQRHGRLPV